MIPRVDDEPFIDLVCSDPGLLRAEFDAIMTAEFPRRRIPHTRRSSGPDRMPRRSTDRSRGGPRARTVIRSGGDDRQPHPRGRSPPHGPTMSLFISCVDPEEAAT